MAGKLILTRLILSAMVASLITISSCVKEQVAEIKPTVDKGKVKMITRKLGPKVTFVPGDNKIDVIIGEKHFTSYLYGDKLPRPILFPVRSPSGIMVNRGYPLLEVEGESKNYPHHAGLFFAYRYVNDDDFWLNENFGKDTGDKTQIKHIKVTEMAGGAGKAGISTVIHWIGKKGRILLEENRKMVFYAGENEYAIDFSMDLTAQDTKLTFSDSKEGMFAIQAADWLREDGGSGRYFSSNGDETEENVWGKRARWACLQGEKDGKTIGIAILNHPASVNYPTYWHTRGYGLFSANPLGQHVFEKTRHPDSARPFHLTLQPGDVAHFGFRMIIYEGTKTREQLEQRFEEFVK